MGKRSKRCTAVVMLLTVVCPATFGCERTLFPPNAVRTPYARYQDLRGEHRPAKETNAYGGDQPALRQRLQPLHSQ